MLGIFVRSGFKPIPRDELPKKCCVWFCVCGVYVDVNLTSIKTKDNKIVV